MAGSNRPEKIVLDSGEPLSRKRGRIFARAHGNRFDISMADGATIISLYDEIGPDGISAAAFSDKLNSATGTVVVKINSPGGSVDHGVTMFNDLNAYPGKVRIEITGVAASAASLVAMAGDEIAIAENGFTMIHRVWGLTVGNAGDHTKQADTLSRFDKSLAQTYSNRTGLPIARIQAMMAAETWMNGAEAVNLGFADSILSEGAISASFDLSIYANLPPSLRCLEKSPRQNTQIESRTDLEKQLRDKLGLAHGAARKVACAGFAALAGTQDDQTTIEKLTESVAKAAAQMKNITNVRRKSCETI